MTSAARPTWLPAVGGGSLRDTGKAPLFQTSSKDLNHHTVLKQRQQGQNAPNEVNDRNALKAKLLQAELEHQVKSSGTVKRPLTIAELDEETTSKRRLIAEANLDKDDDVAEDNDSDRESGSDDSESDEDADDTAELLRELEKIKRERAEEKEREERERRELEERAREEAMLAGNPLMSVGGSTALAARDFSVKRRWDDDVVFKNQGRGQDGKVQKRFINDLVRSDFHRKFMAKYVR
ncbi:Pre-mRNA-splicing factor Cwf15/Cwc15 [Zopfochytrium polystomum]|nr:Pre-mRNA-splicing factor Cwf15/Cwc15 [Zopfochytrium polystomum]